MPGWSPRPNALSRSFLPRSFVHEAEPPSGGRHVLIATPAEVHEDADKDGMTEVTPDEPAFDTATDTVTIPSVTGVQYLKDGVNVVNGSEHVITASTVFTATARACYELDTGATASWTYAP